MEDEDEDRGEEEGRLCRRCCGGVGMEMGLRRVVIIPIIMPVVREEEEAEFESFDCFYRDARY